MSSERDKAPQYRQHAKACLELAERMSPASERTRILEMAQHWLELATRAEMQAAMSKMPNRDALFQCPGEHVPHETSRYVRV